MAKAKSPRTAGPATKSLTAKSKTAKKILRMPESGNGNTPQYSPADLEAEIRFRAYELYEHRGCTPGQEADDWIAAEREILSRHDSHKHTA
jgi:hypothetical protein